jgi:hypothetical protein
MKPKLYIAADSFDVWKEDAVFVFLPSADRPEHNYVTKSQQPLQRSDLTCANWTVGCCLHYANQITSAAAGYVSLTCYDDMQH